MKNNKGLSYVELLIVIAIMILLTGVTTVSIGLSTRANATKTADRLVTALKTSRTYSLAKGTERGAFHIKKSGNVYEFSIGTLSEAPEVETLGAHPVQLSYFVGDEIFPIDESAGTITLKFDQSSGALTSFDGGPDLPDGFIVYKGDEPVARITIYELTGKSELKLE